MGDFRYGRFYERFKRSADKAAALHALSDDQVIQALAASSREKDPYDANILATEAMNRMRRSRVITEHLGEGAFAVDVGANLTFVNPAGAARLGTRWEDLVGRSVLDALPFRDHDGSALDLPSLPCMRAMEERQPISFEGGFLHVDGSLVPVSGVAAPVMIEGEPHGAVVTFRDITEREKARTKLAGIIEALSEAVIVTDAEGVVEFANAAACEMFGMEREEIIGKVWLELTSLYTLDGDPIPTEQRPVARALRRELAIGVEVALGPGESARCARVSAVPIPGGGAVVAVADITELRIAEREVRRQRDLYSASLEALGQFGEAILITRGAQIEWANDGFYALLGIQRSEAGILDLRTLIDPADRERVITDLAAQTTGGAAPKLHVVRIVRPDGSRVSVTVAVKLIDRGPPATVFALLRPDRE